MRTGGKLAIWAAGPLLLLTGCAAAAAPAYVPASPVYTPYVQPVQPYVPPAPEYTPYVPDVPAYTPYVPDQYSVPNYIPYEGNGGGPTLCQDGTTSHSSGRGTCSHHGGIA